MIRVVGLDLATSFGWACGRPDARPSFGSDTLPRTDDVGRFLEAYETWFFSFIQPNDLVIYEATIVHPRNTVYVIRKLNSLAGCTELFARKIKGVKCMSATPVAVKHSWTGNGHAKKPEMIEFAKTRGFDVQNDDEADALAVWHHAVIQLDARWNTRYATNLDPLFMGAAAQ